MKESFAHQKINFFPPTQNSLALNILFGSTEFLTFSNLSCTPSTSKYNLSK